MAQERPLSSSGQLQAVNVDDDERAQGNFRMAYGWFFYRRMTWNSVSRLSTKFQQHSSTRGTNKTITWVKTCYEHDGTLLKTYTIPK